MRNKYPLLLIPLFLMLRTGNAQAISCQLKAFNVFWDENFKTPQPDSIKKISIFEPTALTPSSSFQGLLVPKTLVDLKDYPKLTASVKYVSLNQSNRAYVSHKGKYKIEVWSENTDYYVIKGFDGEKTLKSNTPPKPSRIEILLQIQAKNICQENINLAFDE